MAYRSDFPISFLKQYHLSDSISYQSDTFDLIYILAGKLTVTSESGDTIEYAANSVTSLHSGHLYHIIPDRNNILIHLGLRISFMQKHNVPDTHIVCDSMMEPNRNYMHLKNLITNISSQYLDDANDHELSLLGLIFQLMHLLQSDYSVSVSDSPEPEGKYMDRINLIRDYLHNNYRQQISLKDLADSMYLTPQYLSKFFKKHFNMNFNQYLNKYRIEHALKDLLYTDKKITDIAVQHGFPNISTFNRHFKELYQTSPREYRKESLPEPPVSAEWLPENQEFDRPIKAENMYSRDITVYTGFKNYKPHNYTKLLNVGFAKNLQAIDFQTNLLYAARELSLEHVRLEGMIGNSMIPRLSQGNQYYFAHVDDVLDFLYEHDLVPFIELGKNSYLNASSAFLGVGAHLHVNKRRLVPMFEAFLMHVSDYYDPNWLKRWHFELWKSPAESTSEYLNSFETMHALLEKYIPGAAFGGPGHVTSLLSDQLEDLLLGFNRRNITPDFISIHSFTLQYGIDHPENININAANRNLRTQQLWIRKKIRSIFLTDIPLYITEFNSSLIPQTFINESCYQAAFIAKNILEMHEDSDMIGYWMLDDNSFKSKELGLHLVNGISLINKNGIPMPSFHAYRLLNRLGEYVIEQGENYCITESEPNQFQILTYNYAHLMNIDMVMKTEHHSIEDVYSYFEDIPSITMRFTLTGLTSGQYHVKRTLIDRLHGSLMDIYLGGVRSSTIPEDEFIYKMQTPPRSDAEYLRSSCIPEERNIFLEADTELTVSIQLAPHNVCLFEISKEF